MTFTTDIQSTEEIIAAIADELSKQDGETIADIANAVFGRVAVTYDGDSLFSVQ